VPAGGYVSEVAGELRKVVWPTQREVTINTIIVLIAVVVMATLIFGFDYAASRFVLHLFD
jgi:preprotein translocase subunit SecE